MKENDKLVTVIMPAYKAAGYFPVSIGSVIKQTYENWELIIVDDASPDDTYEAAMSFAEKDARIRVIKKTVNEGQGIGRNDALAASKGDYIYFFDSDDEMEPDAIEKMVAAAEEHGADIVCGGVKMRSAGSDKTTVFMPRLEKTVYTGREVAEELLPETIATRPTEASPNGLTVYLGSAFYRKSFLDRIGWQCPSERKICYEDYFSKLNMFGLAEKAVIIREIFFTYILVGGSTMTSYRSDRYDRSRALYGEALKVCDERGYNLETRKRVGWFFISNANIAMYNAISRVDKKSQLELIRKILNDELFRKAVAEWKREALPRTRKILFAAYRLRCAALLRILMKAQLKRM